MNKIILNELLTTPSKQLVNDIKKIVGDIMIIGAGGKMGPSLALLIKKAIDEAGIEKEVIAVSRFTDNDTKNLLNSCDIKTISVDLLKKGEIEKLEETANIIYMLGRKFGTDSQEYKTWSVNASIPTLISRHFQSSRIVVFSTGNIYPMVDVKSNGSLESDRPSPVGEYAMSSLARERIFEYASHEYGNPILLYRLNYAIDLRYGVLHDIATKIMNDEPIEFETSCFNCVWQGYANEVAIRSLLIAESPAKKLNVTGPEKISVAYAAQKLGEYLNKKPILIKKNCDTAYLSDASECFKLFGHPSVNADILIKWQAQWLLSGGESLGIPTHFQERRGNY